MGWFALVVGASSEILRSTFEHRSQRKGFSRPQAASGLVCALGHPVARERVCGSVSPVTIAATNWGTRDWGIWGVRLGSSVREFCLLK